MSQEGGPQTSEQANQAAEEANDATNEQIVPEDSAITQQLEQQEQASEVATGPRQATGLKKKKKKMLKKKKKKVQPPLERTGNVDMEDEVQKESRIERQQPSEAKVDKKSKSQGKVQSRRNRGAAVNYKIDESDEDHKEQEENPVKKKAFNRAKTPEPTKREREAIENESMDSDEYQERATQVHGLIKDHKEPWESGTYKIGKVLGSGMIGVCCLCQDEQNNLLYCLKHMSIEKIREKNLFKNIKEEIEIMYDLIGIKGVCQLEDIIINDDKDVTMVLPFYAHTDLWNFMKVKPGRHLSEKDARTIFAQLVDIFDAIHKKLVMHRDIKPENILVKNDELEVCLADFGLATRNGPFPDYEKTRTGQAGTPCYYCYEIIKKLPYDERCDVWGLGVLLYEMLFGGLPFNHSKTDIRDYSASISSLKWKYPKSSIVGQEPRDLISKILVPQERRISLEDVRLHPWFSIELGEQ